MSSGEMFPQEIDPNSPKFISMDGVQCPAVVGSVAETGLDETVISDLALRMAATVPQCTTDWVARQICLPLTLVEALLQQMKNDKVLQVLGTAGPSNSRYTITNLGREQAARLFEVCGYVGPAPVSLEAYSQMLDWQISQFIPATFEDVQRALSELVLPDPEVHTAALAVMSQRSLFMSGPPGNGKTSVARSLHEATVGELWIPHCLGIGADVIRVFDKQIHEPSEFLPSEAWKVDQRWIRIKRPLIIVGGEMTIESLDLSYSPALRFYEAPLHFKANGGTFVIDDFGRQRVAPTELLNRWIIPMENSLDFLTLKTGLKITVPFRLMLAVATNLDPNRVMDPAFLRRMGYRIYVGAPSEEHYVTIFHNYAKRYDATVPDDVIQRLLNRYRDENRELRGCEPRDLIDRCSDICKLHNRPFEINDEHLNTAWNSYFGVFHPDEESRSGATV